MIGHRSLAALADEPVPAATTTHGGWEGWQRNIGPDAVMPASVALLDAYMRTRREPVTRSHAVRIMGLCDSNLDRALSSATWWPSGLYESDDGLIFLAGVVDDEAVTP